MVSAIEVLCSGVATGYCNQHLSFIPSPKERPGTHWWCMHKMFMLPCLYTYSTCVQIIILTRNTIFFEKDYSSDFCSQNPTRNFFFFFFFLDVHVVVKPFPTYNQIKEAAKLICQGCPLVRTSHLPAACSFMWALIGTTEMTYNRP